MTMPLYLVSLISSLAASVIPQGSLGSGKGGVYVGLTPTSWRPYLRFCTFKIPPFLISCGINGKMQDGATFHVSGIQLSCPTCESFTIAIGCTHVYSCAMAMPAVSPLQFGNRHSTAPTVLLSTIFFH